MFEKFGSESLLVRNKKHKLPNQGVTFLTKCIIKIKYKKESGFNFRKMVSVSNF